MVHDGDTAHDAVRFASQRHTVQRSIWQVLFTGHCTPRMVQVRTPASKSEHGPRRA